VERLHRQLKAAIMCRQEESWSETLPAVLHGIRAAVKEDSGTTPAEMVFGEALRLPGDLIAGDDQTEVSVFVEQLRNRMRELKPAPRAHHGHKRVFVFKELDTASHVFVRRDAVKKPLQPPYEGPFLVVSRSSKNFVIKIGQREVSVSKDRLKPVFAVGITERDGSM
ncbi:hypothetical protein WN55_08600, partial [Dufourea novaeangliae]